MTWFAAIPLIACLILAIVYGIQWRRVVRNPETPVNTVGIAAAKEWFYSAVAYIFLALSILLIAIAFDMDSALRPVMAIVSMLCLAMYVAYTLWERLTKKRREEQRQKDVKAYVQAVHDQMVQDNQIR